MIIITQFKAERERKSPETEFGWKIGGLDLPYMYAIKLNFFCKKGRIKRWQLVQTKAGLLHSSRPDRPHDNQSSFQLPSSFLFNHDDILHLITFFRLLEGCRPPLKIPDRSTRPGPVTLLKPTELTTVVVAISTSLSTSVE